MIGFTRVGGGEPLVLIHALGTDRHMWDPVLGRLARERDVIALDMPGFGESPTLAELARRGALGDGLGPAGHEGHDGGLDPARVAALGGGLDPARVAALGGGLDPARVAALGGGGLDPARLAALGGGGLDPARLAALGGGGLDPARLAPLAGGGPATPARLAALAGGGPATPADLAAAIHTHLDALGLDRPHVAGNSLGGWVALELALAGRARSVTAIAPAGMWAQPLAPKRSAARQLARALRPALPSLLKTARGRRLALGGTTVHPERIPYAAALQLVLAYAGAPGFDAANDGMRAGRFTGLDEISVPLTLAWPERDRLVGRPRHVPAHAQELVLRGCGHMPTWDDPEQVAAVLLAGSAATTRPKAARR